MALEPGGYADKLGNRYEGRWIARQLLRVLNEDLRSVTIEAIGDDERGADLWVVSKNGVRQAQQCKLRNLSKDSWSIADLYSRGVLAAMALQLERDPNYQFALVSAIPCTILHDLSTSARNSPGDPEAYYVHQIQAIGEDRRRCFSQFCQYLEIDSGSEAGRAQAYSYLARTYIENWPDTVGTQTDLAMYAEMLVAGSGRGVLALLADYAQENLRRTMDAVSVWGYLEGHGLSPRRIAQDERSLPAIQGLQEGFFDSIEPDLIAGQLLERDETSQVLAAIQKGEDVVLYGDPGGGKSGVLYELGRRLEADHTLFLPVRLDRQVPKKTPQHFGVDLGLRESPVLCLDSIGDEKPTLLILDQLDAIRWTSRHSFNSLEVCKSLVREIRYLQSQGKPLHFILACRTYDLRNDPEIRSWLQGKKNTHRMLTEIEVKPLSEECIRSVLARIDVPLSSLSAQEVEILRSPQHLAMWYRLTDESGLYRFQNRIQLIRGFWRHCMDAVQSRGLQVSAAESAIDSVVNYMEQNGRLSAPESVVIDTTSIHPLCSVGLLRHSNSQITFAHQSYLDFRIALGVVRSIHKKTADIAGWLGSKSDQTLFRREQLRQALCLLAEESPEEFLNALTSLLPNRGIRFHVKHLCLEVVSQLGSPGDAIKHYLKSLLLDAKWQEHVIPTVYIGRPQFCEHLIDDGTLSSWLDSDDERDNAISILRWVADSLGEKVATLLSAYIGRDADWDLRVLRCLPWNLEEDTESLFTLRVALAKRGICQEHISWAELPAERRLPMLEAIVSALEQDDLPHDYSGRASHSVLRHVSQEDRDAFVSLAESQPRDIWDSLLPHIQRLAQTNDDSATQLELWLDADRDAIRRGMEVLPNLLVRMVIAAGRFLAAEGGKSFWEETAGLRSADGPVIRFLLIECYRSLPKEVADNIVEWLAEDPALFSVGSGALEPEWMPTARLIETASRHCSDRSFQDLERCIIHFHSPNERRDAEYWLPMWKNGYFGDYWGRTQLFLLPALDQSRVGKDTIGLIGVLKHKFARYPEARFVRRSHGWGGFVTSTLPSQNAEDISNNAWLEIVRNGSVPSEHGHPRQLNEDTIQESSVHQFAIQLASLSKRFPERFGQLALEFSEAVSPRYKAAIIDGLKETTPKHVPEQEQAEWRPAPSELVERVVAHFGASNDREFAQGFCWLLYQRAEDSWSESAFDTLCEYARRHPNPEPGKLNIYPAASGPDAGSTSASNLEGNALNCVRSVAVLAIGELLWHHPELLPRFRPVLDEVAQDKHPVVLAALVRGALPVLNLDKTTAVNWFAQAASGDLRVAATRHAVYYFNMAVTSHGETLEPIVREMLASPSEDVAEQGAAEATARWLFHGVFDDCIERCLSGQPNLRKGVAKVASHFATNPVYAERCASLLQVLKNDADAEVRRRLFPLLRSPELLATESGRRLALELVDSQAFRDDPDCLVYSLKEYSGDLLAFSEMLLSISSQFTGPLRAQTKDPRQSTMRDASRVFPLLLRLYEQADEVRDEDVANACLDAFDSMFEARVGMTNELAKLIG